MSRMEAQRPPRPSDRIKPLDVDKVALPEVAPLEFPRLRRLRQRIVGLFRRDKKM